MTEPARTTVVVADDDADIRALVGIAVGKANLDLVASAADGDSAWDAIQLHRPALAVLDVSMPGYSGLDLCRLIRSDGDLETMTVVLLSAAVDEAAREAGIAAGATEYLAKPFSPKGLAARLVEIVAVYR